VSRTFSVLSFIQVSHVCLTRIVIHKGILRHANLPQIPKVHAINATHTHTLEWIVPFYLLLLFFRPFLGLHTRFFSGILCCLSFPSFLLLQPHHLAFLSTTGQRLLSNRVAYPYTTRTLDNPRHKNIQWITEMSRVQPWSEVVVLQQVHSQSSSGYQKIMVLDRIHLLVHIEIFNFPTSGHGTFT